MINFSDLDIGVVFSESRLYIRHQLLQARHPQWFGLDWILLLARDN